MQPSSVSRRRVYYIGGFDPRGPGFYYRLMRRQARRSHGACVLSERRSLGPQAAGWTMTRTEGSATVHVEYIFLRWDDVARRRWGKSPLWMSARLATCVPHYVRARIWSVARRCSRAVTVAAWFPLVCVALLTGLACLFALGAGVFCKQAGFPPEAAFLSVACTLPAALRLSGLAAEKLKALWLMRIFLFYRDWAKGLAPEADARVVRFAERIAADTERDEGRAEAPDEILVAGHSVGCALAPRVLAGALRLLPHPINKDRFALLTMGHSVPLLGRGNLRTEQHLRDCAYLDEAGVPWTDVSSAADGACFAGADPSMGAHRQVVIRSPRFFAYTPPALYKKWKRNPYHMHFLYLTSPVIPGGFDYLHVTAGPLPLAGNRFFDDEPGRTPAVPTPKHGAAPAAVASESPSAEFSHAS